MTLEEYGMLLRIEYGSWQQARREYESGRRSRESAIVRMNRQRTHILNWKQACRDNLEEYPEEYYLETPDPAEKLLQAEENTPEKLIAINKMPEGNGTQMNILDYIRDGEICWR